MVKRGHMGQETVKQTGRQADMDRKTRQMKRKTESKKLTINKRTKDVNDAVRESETNSRGVGEGVREGVRERERTCS